MSANVVGVINPKGGAGKTTIAIHLAHGLSKLGPTLLVDSDPQGSARDWQAQREEPLFPVVGMDRPTLSTDIPDLAKGYDWIVIDGAARLEKQTISAIKACDLVLIPVRASPLDIWAVADLIETIKSRQELADGRPGAGVVITAVKKGTMLAREVRDALNDYDIPIISGMVYDRTVFARSLATGSTAYEESDPAAVHEIDHLVRKVQDAFNGD